MEINEETNSLESTEESNEKILWLDHSVLYNADGRKSKDGNFETASSRITEATVIPADEFIDGDLLIEINEETNSLESKEKIPWLDYAAVYHADGRKCKDGNFEISSSRSTEVTDVTANEFFEPRFHETSSPGITDELIDGDFLMVINEETNSLESIKESNEKFPWLDYSAKYHTDGRKCEDETLATASSTITEATDVTANDFFQETSSPGMTDELNDGDFLMEINEETNSLESTEECIDGIPWLDYAALYHTDGRKCEAKDRPARKTEIMEELRMISETVQGMIEAAPQAESVLIQPQKRDIQKIKVDCPHCNNKVTAVRFVPHLSKCLGNGGRKCTRRKKRYS